MLCCGRKNTTKIMKNNVTKNDSQSSIWDFLFCILRFYQQFSFFYCAVKNKNTPCFSPREEPFPISCSYWNILIIVAESEPVSLDICTLCIIAPVEARLVEFANVYCRWNRS